MLISGCVTEEVDDMGGSEIARDIGTSSTIGGALIVGAILVEGVEGSLVIA